MQTSLSQPSIEIFGTTIAEPMVTLTDLMITAVCVYAFVQLTKLGRKGKVHKYIRWYFGIMAIATLLGGLLGHAFQEQVGLAWKLPGWLISMLAVMAIERASIMHAKPILNRKLGRFLEIANVVELLTFCGYCLYNAQLFIYSNSLRLRTWFGGFTDSFLRLLENPQ